MTPADAAAALLPAVYRRLADDAPLTSLLGGPRVYDHVPRNAARPYVALGDIRARDLSTSTEAAAEVLFAVAVLSEANGRGEALQIAARVVAALDVDGAALAIPGFRLVSLLPQALEAPRGADRDRRLIARFRAVIEPE